MSCFLLFFNLAQQKRVIQSQRETIKPLKNSLSSQDSLLCVSVMCNLPTDLAHGCLCDLCVCRHPVGVSCCHCQSADRVQRLSWLGWDATLLFTVFSVTLCHSSSPFYTLYHSSSLYFSSLSLLTLTLQHSQSLLTLRQFYFTLSLFFSYFYSPPQSFTLLHFVPLCYSSLFVSLHHSSSFLSSSSVKCFFSSQLFKVLHDRYCTNH